MSFCGWLLTHFFLSVTILCSVSATAVHSPTEGHLGFFQFWGFFSFLRQSLVCHPGWSEVAQSWLITASAFWVQEILLTQPPK